MHEARAAARRQLIALFLGWKNGEPAGRAQGWNLISRVWCTLLIYTDANVLLTLANYKKVNRYVVDDLRGDLFGKKVRVPQVVLGEISAKLYRGVDDPLKRNEYCQNISGILDRFKPADDMFPPPTMKVIECAKDLNNRDRYVKNMDALILAHAIVDEDATRLYTSDRSLRSEAVIEYTRNLVKGKNRKQRLRISGDFNL